MRRQDHVRRTEKAIGEGWDKVHKWMDAYAAKYPPDKYGAYHRKFRHHREGVEEVGRMWGPEAMFAAALHVMDDWGFIPDKKFYAEAMEEENGRVRNG